MKIFGISGHSDSTDKRLDVPKAKGTCFGSTHWIERIASCGDDRRRKISFPSAPKGRAVPAMALGSEEHLVRAAKQRQLQDSAMGIGEISGNVGVESTPVPFGVLSKKVTDQKLIEWLDQSLANGDDRTTAAECRSLAKVVAYQEGTLGRLSPEYLAIIASKLNTIDKRQWWPWSSIVKARKAMAGEIRRRDLSEELTEKEVWTSERLNSVHAWLGRFGSLRGTTRMANIALNTQIQYRKEAQHRALSQTPLLGDCASPITRL